MTTNIKERIRENIRQRYYNFEFSKEVSDMGFQTLWLEMENLLDQAVKERKEEIVDIFEKEKKLGLVNADHFINLIKDK